MTLVAPGEHWFFLTDPWASYEAAYGRPHDPHYGDGGNLVVPLGPEPDMLRAFRKGHRADVVHAQQRYTLADSFADYRALHRLANGEVRSEVTFDLMRSWPHRVRVAMLAGRPVAAAYFIVYGAGSYYASGPRDPLVTARGAAHLLIWDAMKALAAQGVRWMDMGPLGASDPKGQAIEHFKKGFGGVVMRWPYE